MIRGTTEQFKFKLPYPKEELRWLTIKFWQTGNPSELLPITKKIDNCVQISNDNIVCVSLTAEETARFSDKFKAKVQLRGKHELSGTVFGCKPKLINVYPMNDEMLEENPAAQEN